MQLCSDRHEPILFKSGNLCPLCDMIVKTEELEDAIAILEQDQW